MDRLELVEAISDRHKGYMQKFRIIKDAVLQKKYSGYVFDYDPVDVMDSFIVESNRYGDYDDRDLGEIFFSIGGFCTDKAIKHILKTITGDAKFIKSINDLSPNQVHKIISNSLCHNILGPIWSLLCGSDHQKHVLDYLDEKSDVSFFDLPLVFKDKVIDRETEDGVIVKTIRSVAFSTIVSEVKADGVIVFDTDFAVEDYDIIFVNNRGDWVNYLVRIENVELNTYFVKFTDIEEGVLPISAGDRVYIFKDIC